MDFLLTQGNPLMPQANRSTVYLTIPEAAATFGVPEETIKSLVGLGKVPAQQRGDSLKVPMSALQQLSKPPAQRPSKAGRRRR
jgi:hypothetical protein